MGVMILLIIVNLAVMVLIMWLVMHEPHKEYKGNHPFVVAERETRRLQSVEPPAEAPAEQPKNPEQA